MPASLTLNWPAETLWSQIEPHWPGFSVEVLPTLDSTNSTLMERARAGQAWPVLLVAPGLASYCNAFLFNRIFDKYGMTLE